VKIALIQDSLLIKGGSERVFQYMVEAFPEADIFTLAYNPQTAWPDFKKFEINTSWANGFIQDHARFKVLFPLGAKIFEYSNLKGYDLIISSSATVAKYISRFDGLHVCYCYYPTRAIWNPDGYFNNGGLKEKVFRILLPYLRRQDMAASKRVDKFIAISVCSQAAIKKIYGRESEVICSPIDFDHFRKGALEEKGDHYLIVSRLEHWKKLDYAIDAFNQLGLPLKVIGSGKEEASLKSMAKENIYFMGNIDDAGLVREYGRAKAVIFTPELEYGLVPLEANAAGTPVIALGRGGVTETMIPARYCDVGDEQATALFFDTPTASALIEAVEQFDGIDFDRGALTRHAAKYSIPAFKTSLRDYIAKLTNERGLS